MGFIFSIFLLVVILIVLSFIFKDESKGTGATVVLCLIEAIRRLLSSAAFLDKIFSIVSLAIAFVVAYFVFEFVASLIFTPVNKKNHKQLDDNVLRQRQSEAEQQHQKIIKNQEYQRQQAEKEEQRQQAAAAQAQAEYEKQQQAIKDQAEAEYQRQQAEREEQRQQVAAAQAQAEYEKQQQAIKDQAEAEYQRQQAEREEQRQQSVAAQAQAEYQSQYSGDIKQKVTASTKKEILVPKEFQTFNFKNKFIDSPMKNTAYMEKFAQMGKIFAKAKRHITNTDKLIQEYEQKDIKIPLNVENYNKFKSEFYEADHIYWNQKKGEDGEKKVVDDLLESIKTVESNHQINIHYYILSNVSIPFNYQSSFLDEDEKSNHTEKEHSTQVDVLLICNYGIYAFEVKNYNADQISIKSVKSKNNKQLFERINGRIVPQGYINKIFNHENGDNDNEPVKGYNMISHQTYIHRQALLEHIGKELGLKESEALNIVHSPMVYANENIDQDGHIEGTNREFYLGNEIERLIKNKNGQFFEPWRNTAIPSKGSLKWVLKYHSPKSLSNGQIDKIYESLKNRVGVKYEIEHPMWIVKGSSKDFSKFVGRWYYYNQWLEEKLK